MAISKYWHVIQVLTMDMTNKVIYHGVGPKIGKKDRLWHVDWADSVLIIESGVPHI